MIVALRSNLEIAVELLKYKAQLNKQNSTGMTATMIATMAQSDTTLALLIKLNADLNIKDNLGETALIKAIYKSNIEAVEMLVKAKANLNIQNNEGRTATIIASKKRPNGSLTIINI
jgi:ankyrin repeat protein